MLLRCSVQTERMRGCVSQRLGPLDHTQKGGQEVPTHRGAAPPAAGEQTEGPQRPRSVSRRLPPPPSLPPSPAPPPPLFPVSISLGSSSPLCLRFCLALFPAPLFPLPISLSLSFPSPGSQPFFSKPRLCPQSRLGAARSFRQLHRENVPGLEASHSDLPLAKPATWTAAWENLLTCSALLFHA